MDIKIDKKLDKKELDKPFKWNIKRGKSDIKDTFAKAVHNGTNKDSVSGWNFLYAFVFFVVLFTVLIVNVAKLQIVQGSEMAKRSEENKIRILEEKAYRGVIFDSNGEKLVENIPSMSVSISIEPFLTKGKGLDNQKLEEVSNTLQGILGGEWKKTDPEDSSKEYTSIAEKIFSMYSSNPYLSNVLIALDIDNEEAIKIKARANELPGVILDNGSKRHYIYGEYLTHILGYTGEASLAEIESSEEINSGDIVGKIGVERQYNERFQGTDGQYAVEIDAFGRAVTSEPYMIKAPVSGQNLHLTIDMKVQKKLTEYIKEGVEKNDATGGAAVIEDVQTGEILAIVSYPSYDGNLFVGGISSKAYTKLLNDKDKPLINRAIAAQMPPGSTFKTIVASAALDAKAINTSTTYISRSGYTFSNGAPFQEFRKHSYGPLNVVSALAVSSNIYFCELIRDWDMNKLVPYLEKFGIGENTGIDIPGEAPGRLPSPENKVKLAKTTNPWLEPVWYPEGDSCNSVIGQGITLVTPIQMANWMAAIANDGTLHTPHVAKKFVDEKNQEYILEYSPKATNIVSKEALKITKTGMWETVNGSRGIVGSLSTTGTTVAAKTGTAEFGKVNEKGIYEHTHAWAGGFFPFDKPKYSFSVFLEDGGMSTNASNVMRNMITWMVQNGYLD